MTLVRGRSQTTLTRFWLFFDHLPPFVDIFYGINVDKCGHFWTTYRPRLVNVVFEGPLITPMLLKKTYVIDG